MSSILDALQKSERARAQQRSFALNYGEGSTEKRLDSDAYFLPTASVSSSTSTPWLLLGLFIGIVLVLLAVIALLLWQPRSPATTSSTAAATPSTPAVVMVPWSNPTVAPEMAMPATVPPQAAPSTSTEGFAEASSEALPPDDTAANTFAAALPPTLDNNIDNTVDNVAIDSTGMLPTLAELPQDLRQQLPPLEMDIHAYDPNPEKRFVFINLVRYEPGDYLKPDLLLQAITREGVILRFQDLAFRVLLQE